MAAFYFHFLNIDTYSIIFIPIFIFFSITRQEKGSDFCSLLISNLMPDVELDLPKVRAVQHLLKIRPEKTALLRKLHSSRGLPENSQLRGNDELFEPRIETFFFEELNYHCCLENEPSTSCYKHRAVTKRQKPCYSASSCLMTRTAAECDGSAFLLLISGEMA